MPMKILLITPEAPLNPGEVVSGNAVRAQQLVKALTGAGHAVAQTWLSSSRSRIRGSFRNRDELQGILLAEAPDALIVGYWELLGLLPCDLKPYVILDYVAPRSLEELFESPQTVRSSLRRLRLNLERCDAILTGNQAQGFLLLNGLIEAGFDLRGNNPVLTVPLGAEPVGLPLSGPTDHGWRLVAGGVDWPWRDAGSYAGQLESIAAARKSDLTVTQFGGAYKWHRTKPETEEGVSGPARSAVDFQKLVSYHEFSRFLSEKAHIGIELAEKNLERQFSQSFRSLEFLRHGLPLLCNDYLPIAPLVKEFDAGWLVGDPGELPDLVDRITSNEQEWRRKSENALKLVSEALQPNQAAQPLLDWLEFAVKARRLPAQTLRRLHLARLLRNTADRCP